MHIPDVSASKRSLERLCFELRILARPGNRPDVGHQFDCKRLKQREEFFSRSG